MNLVCLVVIGVLFKGHISNAHEKWTCTTTTDLFGSSSNNELEERVSYLEGQIKRLEDRVIPKIPIDCEDIYKNGTRINGVYKISPDGRPPFPVYCDMTNGGWTLIQRRVDGIVAFNRTWREYAFGFGDLEGSYWLGLEKIHRLTKDGTQIYFDMAKLDGSKVYAHYLAFRVGDGTTAYTMSVDKYGYTGSIQDLLSYHGGMKFSTYDRDNDGNSGTSCSIIHGNSGWWYNDCYNLGNLNGVYDKRDPSGLNYYTSTSGNIFLKTNVIKVKGIE